MKTQTVAKQAQKQAAKKQQAAKQDKKPSSLFYFHFTPSGRMLRAYFVAFIMKQTGDKLQAGKAFKLWPNANIRGHLDTKRIIREANAYQLTAQGYNYFTDPQQAADADMVKAFTHAITTGEKPKFHNHDMAELKA